ncbi:MAG: hypothetical protein GC161_03195 [Planctomycetaceae bacterium]|nr:hypothetical protein [Planctomycetaceae bacterium]
MGARATRGARTARLVVLVWALAALAAGCVAPGADVHLAPLYTRSTGPDRLVRTEALGGAYVSERGLWDEAVRSRALRPLFGWQDQRYTAGIEGSRTDFLPPFGYRERDGDHVTSVFFPFYYWRSRPGPEPGTGREYDLVSLPGWIWSKNARGKSKLGWFPFWGDLDGFLTWDNVRFVLFPLYTRTQRGDSIGHHVLFPIFAWTSDGRSEERTWRVFPLAGVSKKPGRYERHFYLWPIVHWHRNHLHREPERQETKWMVWPLLGRTKVASYRAWTVLWPFFGYAYDRESGFWAWDGPWFLVRLQGGGRDPLAEERTRLWPLYSHFKGDGLEEQSYAWPIVRVRQETVPDFERASFYVLPFWQAFDLTRLETGSEESYRKLWPLYQSYSAGDRSRTAFPALNPFQRLPLLEFHYAWLWELYTRETDGPRTAQRTWAGLWRAESQGDEHRTSVAGLWSRRSYGPAEARVAETSLFFGLVRWRSGPAESRPGLLAPALPGPGWPALWNDDPLADEPEAPLFGGSKP